ncbi:hypothetical protein [Granulicella paludicola]|nr:hypothetical protein [Granulicella paludicola]
MQIPFGNDKQKARVNADFFALLRDDKEKGKKQIPFGNDKQKGRET